jgi:murein DD-endopeptidase MepM/ murein hydrolase activator NlpD
MQPTWHSSFLRAVRLLLPLSLVLVAVVVALATRQLEAFNQSPFPVASPPAYSDALAGQAPIPEIAPGETAAALVPVEYEIRPGDTLASLLADRGLDPAEAWSATAELGKYLDARKLRAGDRYAVLVAGGGSPAAFRFDVGDRGRVALVRSPEAWETQWTPYQREVRVAAVTGVLEGSLDESIQAAGGAPALAYRMADVLQWDLDFNRDLRVGDRFEVLYEEVYLDGRFSGLGQVLALSYQNGSRGYEVFRFGDDGGYYDAEGRPLEKMFLRSPLTYSRITSRFSSRRFHPVLKTFRPHYGVDYGAAVGTPVRVTAGGVVVFAGWSGGGGRMVKVRHPKGYVTGYLHLSRFAAGVTPGARVSQGQVIAFTGATGLVSGPHLDYRIQHDGRWIDPLSLRNVPAQPVPVAQLARFHSWRDACRHSLELGQVAPELLLAAKESGAESPGVPAASVAEPSSSSLGFGTAGR